MQAYAKSNRAGNPTIYSIVVTSFFFHPDCNCRLRILTESALSSSRAYELVVYRR